MKLSKYLLETIIGTCVDSFDVDGHCINDKLPYRDSTDFAQDEEHNFVKAKKAGIKVKYNPKKDIHYFFEKLNESNEENKVVGLHITHGKFLKSILKKGLIPKSPSLGREQVDDTGVYFFPDEITMEDAMGSWLEDFFDEDEKVFCLTVDITGFRQHIGGDYEIIVTEPIPPSRIISYKNIDLMDGEQDEDED